MEAKPRKQFLKAILTILEDHSEARNKCKFSRGTNFHLRTCKILKLLYPKVTLHVIANFTYLRQSSDVDPYLNTQINSQNVKSEKMPQP